MNEQQQMTIRIEDERRFPGHYNDTGPGGAMIWYPEETVIRTNDGDSLRIEAAGSEQRVVWRQADGGFMDLTRASPALRSHRELVTHWRQRFVHAKNRAVMTP